MRTSASTTTVADRALTAVVTTRARSAESIVYPGEWFPVSARLPGHNPQGTPARKLAPVRDGPVPRVQLLWAAALLLLEAIASDAQDDSELAFEIAGLLGEAERPAPPPAEPAWPGQPLTQSETRVLRYLPTHMGAPEIAAELFLSANTVKTHLKSIYRKLSADHRRDAVRRARKLHLV